jgi:hypothetical protein
MKKKLTLNRETLRSLDQLHLVVAEGTTYAIACQNPTVYGIHCNTGTGTENTYGDTCYTNACSVYCETGGACTGLTCGC